MSIHTEFAEDIERRRRRLAMRQMWFRMSGPVGTQTLLIAASLLIALGAFLGVLLVGGLVSR